MNINLIEISDTNPFQNHIDDTETNDCVYCTIDELERVITDVGKHGDQLVPMGSREFELRFWDIYKKIKQ